jgi:hypothetical protein
VAWKVVPLVTSEVHRVHQPLAQDHHLLQLCPYPIQRHVVHRRAHMLGQQVHIPSRVILSRSDGLLVQRNFSECDLIGFNAKELTKMLWV